MKTYRMNKAQARNYTLSGIQINAAVEYLDKLGKLRGPKIKVIGRDVPACPPMEEPLWEYNKDKFGFTLPDRLVRWVQTA